MDSGLRRNDGFIDYFQERMYFAKTSASEFDAAPFTVEKSIQIKAV